MKLFMTGSSAIIQECRTLFRIQSIPNLIYNRKLNFWNKFVEIDDNTTNYVVQSQV